MSYPDPSEYDDRAARRARSTPGGRPTYGDPAGYAGASGPAYPGPETPSRRPVTGSHRYGDGVSAYPLYHGAPGQPEHRADLPGAPPAEGAPPRPDATPARPDVAPAHPSPPGAGRTGNAPAGPNAGAPRSPGRAGRNLPAAIGVGVLLGGSVLASLIFWRPAFLGVIAVAVSIGIWEMVRAVRNSGARPPMVPLIGGGILMVGMAWWGHVDALTFGLVVTLLAVMVWRLADGAAGYGRDVGAAALIAVYVPFLAGFAALLVQPGDGSLRVLVTLAVVVLSDTGGYVAGVLFGRHPMAPSVSPKKSWEGLAGSLVATGAGGALLLFFIFNTTLWRGAVFGLAISMVAVLGDLAESLIKRDLGVKDMSNLLPGHGGLMDRLDSILLAAPTAYVLFALLVPAG